MEKRQLVLVAVFAVGLFAVQSFFKPTVQPPTPNLSTATVPWELEQRYVLENPVQQVVLSNLGGSIAEINLSLKSSTDPLSVVKPIRADQRLSSVAPRNDRFPLLSAKSWNPQTGLVQTIEQGQEGGYYPLLRRGLLDSRGGKEALVRPEWYGMSLLTTEGPLTQPFQLKEFGPQRISFQWQEGKKKIVKTFSIAQPPLQDPYLIRTRIETEGDLGPLWVSSGVPEAELIGGNPEPLLQYAMNTSGQVKAEKLDLPEDQSVLSSIYPGWVSTSNGFFSLILNPSSEVGPGFKAQRVPADKALSRLLLLPEQHGWSGLEAGQQWPSKPGDRWAGYRMLMPLGSRPGVTELTLFAGPLDEKVLTTVDQALAAERDGVSPDFSAAKTFYGFFSFVSAPFAKFMWWLMQLFYGVSHNWVASLFLLTVALRLMTWPLNSWAAAGVAKMRAIRPKMAELEKMFANNRQGLQMAQAQLYREHGLNPIAPLLSQLVQIPFLIGMLDLLRQAFPLRGASFIPGWIPDLASPDVLFSWGFHLPLIGSGLHLLPILLSALYLWQGKLMSATPDQEAQSSAAEQKQQAMTGKLLPLIFLFIFYSAPAGLNLYWLFSSILGILQQKLVNRRVLASMNSAKVVPFNHRSS